MYAKQVANYVNQFYSYANQFAASQATASAAASPITAAPTESSRSATATTKSSPVASSSSSAISGSDAPTTSTAVVLSMPTTLVTSTKAISAASSATSGSAAGGSSASAASAAGSPAASGSSRPPAGSGTMGKTYNKYTGDGSKGAGWPAMSDWVKDFDTMWTGTLPMLQKACSTWEPTPPENTAAELQDLHDAIVSSATASSLDARFILAIIMQESHGCLKIWSTASADNIGNPGIMQDHEGTGSCNTNIAPNGIADATKIKTPCPKSEIQQMVTDGTMGTPKGDGIKQTYASVTGADAQKYYAAARKYNSGSVDASNLDNGFSSTASYASDVANRLAGWNGSSGSYGS